ncbi:VTT domain-containing protein [Pseudoduganella namucuonensis]|uniref:Membrane protein DedA, SNARE-associated domain n=1 Tax=Pseudoduganella namucuonensis TaxID=1035707 RepID=A0A1I7LLS9_9BURK|nr:VTT domain-containing protein [Pseudoduganella namucuonensis]SFV10676.1 membrane protein DedA, SNARE-associated domain [Pseudoduganella namucuonensis]
MANLLTLLQEYGVFIVFAIVLIEQMGLPIPAFPLLIVSGALAVTGQLHWGGILGAALLACSISDFFWFRAGRRYGRRILKLLCRISLSPDYCVSQTEDNFRRWGPKSLLVAKFIPGFNTIAPPMSGAMGTSYPRFLGFSVPGGLIWSGSGIAIGAYFHQSIDQVLDILATMGGTALMVLGALLTLFVLFKYVERKRFQRAVQMERVTVDELRQLLSEGHDLVMVDARSATAQSLDPPVPGALLVNGDPMGVIAALPKDTRIIVYCSCPNDVTAAHVAKQMMASGYTHAKPLHGGLEAWNSAFAHELRRPRGEEGTVPSMAS